MEAKRIKRQLSAACHYAYTRLTLNYYMYYETSLEPAGGRRKQEELDRRYHALLKEFLQGEYRLEELDRLRDETVAGMEITTAYTDSFQAYEYVMNRLEGRFGPQLMENHSKETDDDVLTAELMGYITNTKDSAVVNERIQTVLGQLPVRLTRQKFFALVEEGMSVYKGGPRQGLDDMMYILRSEALLNQPENMEQENRDLALILERFKKADYRRMTPEIYRSLTGEMEEAGHILVEDTGAAMALTDLINDLYILMLTRGFCMMEVAEERRLKGILGDLLLLFETGTGTPIPQDITDRLCALEGKQEAYYEQWLRDGLSEEQEAALGDGDLADVYRKTELLMSGSSFMPLHRTDRKEAGAVEEAELKIELEKFFAELEDSWKGQPRVLVRAVMAKILSILPVFFNSLEETQVYIKNSLESCTDICEKESCMKLIRALMRAEY
ncbi:MAG: hypothetical protein ACI4F3_05400 [Enterocloster sp.]